MNLMSNNNPNDPEIKDKGDLKTTHIKTATIKNIKHKPNLMKSVLLTIIFSFRNDTVRSTCPISFFSSLK